MTMNYRKGLVNGVIQGLATWMAYAIVESVFDVLIPLYLNSDSTLNLWSWKLIGVFFGFYAATGVVLGGISGLAVTANIQRTGGTLHKDPWRLHQSAATLVLLLAFAGNQLAEFPRGNSEIVALILSLLLASGLILTTRSKHPDARLSFLSDPWTVSLLLLGIPTYGSWLVSANSPSTILVPLIAFIIALTASIWLHRSYSKLTIQKASLLPPIKSLAPVVGMMVCATGCGLLLSKDVKVTPGVSPSSGDIDRPNIVLVVFDTVRADHTSVHAYERDTTPNLRALAKQASLYTRAIAVSDMTLPAHASMFTGIVPTKHGAHWDPPSHPYGRPLDEKFTTLAEILSDEGYSTLAAVANYLFVNRFYGMDQGFEFFDAQERISVSHSTKTFLLRYSACRCLDLLIPSARLYRSMVTAQQINETALDFLSVAAERNRPFFLFVNYMDAHIPYLPPEPFDSLYPGKDTQLPFPKFRKLKGKVLQNEHAITKEQYHGLVSQYDGGIAYADFHFGRLIAQLKELALYDNSLLIVTSDHGEAFGERSLLEHPVSTYQSQIHVPLIIKYPNDNQNLVTNRLVSQVDLFPTILDVAGIDIPDNIDGKSLLLPEKESPAAVFSEFYKSTCFLEAYKNLPDRERAILSGSHKVITSTSGKLECYDLSTDPGEQHSLDISGNPQCSALLTRLEQWIENQPRLESRPVEMDRKTLDRLRSLGYIQ